VPPLERGEPGAAIAQPGLVVDLNRIGSHRVIMTYLLPSGIEVNLRT
jgi:hypothetical protein